MTMFKHSFFVVLVLLCFFTAHAQVQNPQQLREADALYSKRTWRLVELRERQNKVAMWPSNPLVKVLYDGLANGTLRAYKNDSLTSFWDLEQFFKIGADTFLVRKLINPNSDDDLYTVDTVIERFNAVERVKQLLLLEEVYFDARTAQQRTQIIAIAPLYQKQIAGIDLGFIPLCWLRYYTRNPNEKDARSILANSYMYNNGNPYQKFSYYNWFEQRNFSSFVIKESNPYDIFIMDDPDVKRNGLDALIRAGYSKQQTLEQDHDMYEY